MEVVKNNRERPLEGRDIFRVWKKLQRLQPIVKAMNSPFKGFKEQIGKARDNLI